MTGINNKKNQEFSFSSDNKIKIKSILNRYPKDQKASAVMPLLDLAMRQNEGWIPLGAMKEVSIIINVTIKTEGAARIYPKRLSDKFKLFCTSSFYKHHPF